MQKLASKPRRLVIECPPSIAVIQPVLFLKGVEGARTVVAAFDAGCHESGRRLHAQPSLNLAED